jgi:hypothetical protein
MWKEPDYSSVDHFDEELKPLYKQTKYLNNQISKLCEEREDLKDKITQEAINNLPENFRELTDKQRQWVLKVNSGMAFYHYQEKVLQSLGLYSFGYNPETKQRIISISEYGFDKKKVLKGLHLLMRYLKPETVTDDRHKTTETGIRIMLTGLVEDTTSVFYVHKAGNVTLYESTYSDPKKFESIEKLLEWYDLRKKV